MTAVRTGGIHLAGEINLIDAHLILDPSTPSADLTVPLLEAQSYGAVYWSVRDLISTPPPFTTKQRVLDALTLDQSF
jgi:hypothetical protein